MPGLIALAFLAAIVAAGCEPAPPAPEPAARAYAAAWSKSDYDAMWSLLTDESRQRVGEDGFTKRLPRIAEEMSLRSLDIVVGAATRPAGKDGKPDPVRASVPLGLVFHTSRVGEVKREIRLDLVLAGEKERAAWKVAWTSEDILPGLTPGRLVRMTRLATSRGRIIARDGTELATFVDATVVGVVPGQIKSEAGLLASLSAVLGLKPEEIKAKYTQAWVRPDSFVPIKSLAAAAAAAARPRLSVIEGVQLNPARVRSYPTGLAAQLIGFIGEASDADVVKRSDRGFAAGDPHREERARGVPRRCARRSLRVAFGDRRRGRAAGGDARRDRAGAWAGRRARPRPGAAARRGEGPGGSEGRDRRGGPLDRRDPGDRQPAVVRSEYFRQRRQRRDRQAERRSEAAAVRPRHIR